MFHIKELHSGVHHICSMLPVCRAIRFCSMSTSVVLHKIKKRRAYRARRLEWGEYSLS
jgi:hypothetical protein